jgi:hypothetical protein
MKTKFTEKQQENIKENFEQEDKTRDNKTTIFFSTGGNSQENFTKNLCWRRIGLTQ